MEWFPGSIVEAITVAKSRNAIFVVYVHDASDASKTTDEALANSDVSTTLNSDQFVAIMLENGADNAKQFSQIYPLVLVPSLFFISGQTGIPLEVLGGPLTADTLKLKLNKLLPTTETTTNSPSAPTPSTSAATPTPLHEAAPTPTSSQVTPTPPPTQATPTPPPTQATPKPPPIQATPKPPPTQATPKPPPPTQAASTPPLSNAAPTPLPSQATPEPVVPMHQEPQGQEETTKARVEASAEQGSGEGVAAAAAECSMESQDSVQSGDVSREVEGIDESGQEDDDSLNLEERVERAKVLLAEKQAKDACEKGEEVRQKEVERRKMGQEIAKRRQQQEDESHRAAALERKKDKQDDKLAREKVKAQIAQDRAEREARAALLRGDQPRPTNDPPAAPAPQPNPVPSTSNTTRLKFRLPEGYSSITQFVAQFPADTTLNTVRQHIQDNVTPTLTAFSLASTVHQGSFRLEDESATLRDLGLVPSAILAVLPTGSGGGRVVSKFGGRLWDILWLLLTPITFFLSMVRSLVGRGGGGGGASGERRTAPPTTNGPSEPKRPREEGSATTRYRPSTAYGSRAESRLRREGNIHRLSNPDDDDDDENNTWNGNSTQQM
ncbi:hypothetical protein Pcinc_036173 [Petrolisthes cinctipes]|uniref:UBX domain-containing protein 4 n=1 Tax=Petrolisthes cinctipes TaxID=88211 RepID=A0AAE1BWM7_PETCI|nr:hypothetical protein Pcinc_036173 [Petrolisthes cinctipes]